MLEKIKKFINDYIKPFAGKAAEWIGAHKKGFIAIVVAAVILIAGLIAFLCTRSAQPDFPIFYQKDDKIYVRTPNSNSSSLVSKGYAKEVERYTKLSDDGKRLFYADNFTQENNTSRYNLHVYNGDSTWLNGDRNVTVGKNVTGDYRLKSDSSAVYYMAHDDGAVNLYRYNCESGKSERLAENVADFKLLDKSNQVYYLTSDGLLYRCSEGGDVYIDEAADSFYAYENPDGTQTELYYLKKTKQNGVFDLYLIKDNDKKSDIAAKSITGARFSEYTCGGSLYYFKPSTVKLNWKNWIDDDLAQKDSAMKKPSQFDYWKTENWLGFIPHKVLDEEKYNAALAEYNKKIQRDALRQTLSGVGGEASLSAAYDCYVYRGGVSHLLAQKVATSGILASFKNGEAIVYEKSQFSSPKKIKLSELDVAKVMADPAAFFGELAGNLTSGRNGELEFAMWSEGKLRKSDLGVLSVASEAVFSEDGSTLYIREPIEQSGDLYCYYIDEIQALTGKKLLISRLRVCL